MSRAFAAPLIRWLSAFVFLSIFGRAVFYIGSRLYVRGTLEPFDWVAIPIGLVALYISGMYFKKIREGRGRKPGG